MVLPKGNIDLNGVKRLDYASPQNWSALPETLDSADAVPVSQWTNEQATAKADVFFIHPTTYIGKRGQNKWYADINDKKVNDAVDKGPIKYQATIFNGAGRIYAPRYRQAHLHSFFSKRKTDAQQAINLAYGDVADAFKYFIENINKGKRPFIIAGHSQGSLHGMHLLHDYVNGGLEKNLIVAYLPGWPIPKDTFERFQPCLTPLETGCFCSWRTVKDGYFPDDLHFPGKDILVTNPVSWTLDPAPTKKENQLGGILLDFNTIRTSLVSAWIYEDLLWVNKPRFPWSILFTKRNYHIADYNLFYADVRKNAQDRVNAYFNKQ